MSYEIPVISDSEREFFSLHFGIIFNEKRLKFIWDRSKVILPPKSLKKRVFVAGFLSFRKYCKSVIDIKKESFSASDSELFELQNDIKASMKKHCPLYESGCILAFWYDLVWFNDF